MYTSWKGRKRMIFSMKEHEVRIKKLSKEMNMGEIDIIILAVKLMYAQHLSEKFIDLIGDKDE